jgi:hypothetical protein
MFAAVNSSKNVDELGSRLEELLPDHGFLFVFDEIDACNNSDLYETFRDHNKHGTSENLERLYTVLSIVAPLLGTTNCFPISCSETPDILYLYKLYKVANGVPMIEHVFLEPLQPIHQVKCYLRTIIQLSNNIQISLATLLIALGVNDLDEFVNIIALYSADTPRILHLIAREVCIQ